MVAAAWAERGAAFEAVFDNLTDLEGWPRLGRGLMVFLAMLLAGALAEFLFARVSAEARRRLLAAPIETLAARLGFLALRVVFDLLGIAVFAVVAYAVSLAFFEQFDPMRVFVIAYMLVIVITRLVRLAVRFLLAPSHAAARILPLDDTSARAAARWMIGLAAIAAFGSATVAMLRLLGLPEPLSALFSVAAGSVVALLVALPAWTHRVRVGAALEPADAAAHPIGHAIAHFWHLFAFAYLAVIWAACAENTLMGRGEEAGAVVASFFIVLAVPIVEALVRAGLARLALRDAGGRFQRVLVIAVRIAAVTLALLLLARAWAPDLVALLDTPAGRAVGGALFDVGVALLLAVLLWELIRVAIDNGLRDPAPADGTTAPPSSAPQPSARAQTLLPLVRKTLFGVLIVMVGMIVLSAIGVDIGPLLAGAGVVGLAVGFGAQALIRDIVSGIFFMIDDAFRVGEYIEMGELRGEVESISLRSMRLRHHRGQILVIPFGELRYITNYNRDWVIYKMPFRVPFDTNVQQVKKIVKKIGAELLEDEVLAPNILESLKYQGVVRMGDTAMVIQLKFKCKPREQFLIRRAAYQKVSEAFAKAGIEIAPKGVSVKVDGPPDGSYQKAVAAAVEEAVAEELPPGGAPNPA